MSFYKIKYSKAAEKFLKKNKAIGIRFFKAFEELTEDKTNITGYQFENWHIRYVGLEAAKIIYENNLSLEEYIDLFITEY